MLSVPAILYFLALLLLAVPLERLARRLRVPPGVFLLLLGFLSSELLVGFGIDTGIRWQNFYFAIFYLFLPALIFHAALRIDLNMLRANLFPVLLLSLPLALLSVAIIAAVLYYGVGSPGGFPWLAALIAGALLAATDPAAVLSLPAAAGIPRRLRNILESESLFNDVSSILLFGVLILAATAMDDLDNLAAGGFILHSFLLACGGGLCVGLAAGLLARGLLARWHDRYAFGIVTLACSYASFLAAEELLHASGVMAVLVAGLVLRYPGGATLPAEVRRFGDQLWDFLSRLSHNLIFVLAGVTVTLEMFADRWLAMLLAVAAVLAARLLCVVALLAPLCRLPAAGPVFPPRQQALLCWGGVRGVVTLALALSLPLSLDYWYTIQSMAYGVVLFTLFAQATTIEVLVRGSAAAAARSDAAAGRSDG
ncbi:MAG: cation:proton antiporter [Gammaproteobacteria bacterium]|nr:cation:proton antiporter [Gammaproteobacteria bacterium]